jgi:hypothetical protein
METATLLKSFISDSNAGSLKTSQYPKELKGLKMKVSFGMGAAARVPWISFFTPEMSTSNGYYPVYLYFKTENKLVLAFGVSETNDFGKSWDEQIIGSAPTISEVITKPPRYGDSWVFRTYDVDTRQGIKLSTGDGASLSNEQLDDDLNRILELFAKNLDVSLEDKSSPISAGLFYMEKQLEDFIISNWDNTDFGKAYDLLYEEGVLVSQQYRTGIGPIDILAREKNGGNYVVIELKRNQTSDDTVGQVMRYMGWISENLGDPGVKGIIVAGKYDTKLQYAQKMMPSIDVHLYEVDFRLRPHGD